MAKIEFKVGELVLVSNGFLFEYANVKSLAPDYPFNPFDPCSL